MARIGITGGIDLGTPKAAGNGNGRLTPGAGSVAEGPVVLESDAPLLSRYMLPKVAFTVITVASLLGVTFTYNTVGLGRPLPVVVHWLGFLSLAVLAGGLMWQTIFLKPSFRKIENRQTILFGAAQVRRFTVLKGVALAVAALSEIILLPVYLQQLSLRSVPGGYLLLLAGAVVAMVLAAAIPFDAVLRGLRGENSVDARSAVIEAGWKVPAGSTGLLVLCLACLGFGAARDVILQVGWDPLAVASRIFHLTAFGLWYGGAVWNIFIAVPAARETACFNVVVAAGRQLESFRTVVRWVFVTIITSGLWQAYSHFGLNPAALPGNFFGNLVLAKIGLILALIAIFIACPMWRACSPIAGVCNLEDLAPPGAYRGAPVARGADRGSD